MISEERDCVSVLTSEYYNNIKQILSAGVQWNNLRSFSRFYVYIHIIHYELGNKNSDIYRLGEEYKSGKIDYNTFRKSMSTIVNEGHFVLLDSLPIYCERDLDNDIKYMINQFPDKSKYIKATIHYLRYYYIYDKANDARSIFDLVNIITEDFIGLITDTESSLFSRKTILDLVVRGMLFQEEFDELKRMGYIPSTLMRQNFYINTTFSMDEMEFDSLINNYKRWFLGNMIVLSSFMNLCTLSYSVFIPYLMNDFKHNHTLPDIDKVISIDGLRGFNCNGEADDGHEYDVIHDFMDNTVNIYDRFIKSNYVYSDDIESKLWEELHVNYNGNRDIDILKDGTVFQKIIVMEKLLVSSMGHAGIYEDNECLWNILRIFMHELTDEPVELGEFYDFIDTFYVYDFKHAPGVTISGDINQRNIVNCAVTNALLLEATTLNEAILKKSFEPNAEQLEHSLQLSLKFGEIFDDIINKGFDFVTKRNIIDTFIKLFTTYLELKTISSIYRATDTDLDKFELNFEQRGMDFMADYMRILEIHNQCVSECL